MMGSDRQVRQHARGAVLRKAEADESFQRRLGQRHDRIVMFLDHAPGVADQQLSYILMISPVPFPNILFT